MTWTGEDIVYYKEHRNRHLGSLYASAGIPIEKPEERAKYLAEEVLKLTMTDHDVIMRLANKEGSAAALLQLEHIVFVKFF